MIKTTTTGHTHFTCVIDKEEYVIKIKDMPLD